MPSSGYGTGHTTATDKASLATLSPVPASPLASSTEASSTPSTASAGSASSSTPHTSAATAPAPPNASAPPLASTSSYTPSSRPAAPPPKKAPAATSKATPAPAYPADHPLHPSRLRDTCANLLSRVEALEAHAVDVQAREKSTLAALTSVQGLVGKFRRDFEPLGGRVGAIEAMAGETTKDVGRLALTVDAVKRASQADIAALREELDNAQAEEADDKGDGGENGAVEGKGKKRARARAAEGSGALQKSANGGSAGTRRDCTLIDLFHVVLDLEPAKDDPTCPWRFDWGCGLTHGRNAPGLARALQRALSDRATLAPGVSEDRVREGLPKALATYFDACRRRFKREQASPEAQEARLRTKRHTGAKKRKAGVRRTALAGLLASSAPVHLVDEVRDAVPHTHADDLAVYIGTVRTDFMSSEVTDSPTPSAWSSEPSDLEAALAHLEGREPVRRSRRLPGQQAVRIDEPRYRSPLMRALVRALNGCTSAAREDGGARGTERGRSAGAGAEGGQGALSMTTLGAVAIERNSAEESSDAGALPASRRKLTKAHPAKGGEGKGKKVAKGAAVANWRWRARVPKDGLPPPRAFWPQIDASSFVPRGVSPSASRARKTARCARRSTFTASVASAARARTRSTASPRPATSSTRTTTRTPRTTLGIAMGLGNTRDDDTIPGWQHDGLTQFDALVEAGGPSELSKWLNVGEPGMTRFGAREKDNEDLHV
ncbi:hypothetical protein JCM10450v2_003583 [Rhodotorula kratochvilovae]